MIPQGKNTYIEKYIYIYIDTEKRYFKELVHILWGKSEICRQVGRLKILVGVDVVVFHNLLYKGKSGGRILPFPGNSVFSLKIFN